MGDDIDPVPAAAFDTIEGVVGHLAYVFRTQRVIGRPDCCPDAYCNGERPACGIERSVADGAPKTFGALL